MHPVAANVLALVLAKARLQSVFDDLAYALQGLLYVCWGGVGWGRGVGGRVGERAAMESKQRGGGAQALRPSDSETYRGMAELAAAQGAAGGGGGRRREERRGGGGEGEEAHGPAQGDEKELLLG